MSKEEGETRQTRDGHKEEGSLGAVDIITSLGGLIIASLVVLAAVDNLRNGSASLGWTLLAGAMIVGLASLLNAITFRNS